MDTCVACGAQLGVGRFCLNCGHRIGAPAPPPAAPPSAAPEPAPPAPRSTATVTGPDADGPGGPGRVDDLGSSVDVDPGVAAGPRPAPAVDASLEPAPVQPPVQAADPTPVPPTTPPAVTPRPGWDPREDLLPYEEVDDLEGDLPVRGKAWIGWVLGAALLVALAMFLLRVFDTDDVATDPAATEPTTSETGGPADGEGDGSGGAGGAGGAGDGEAAGVGDVVELARGARFDVPDTAPPTTDLDGNLVAYEASQMGDGDPATAWRTPGDATGQTITITLAEPGVVTEVGLVNGYAKRVAGVTWYPHNRRTVAVRWGFDDGSAVEQTLVERPAMQRIAVPPVETATLTLTLTAVTPPGTSSLGRDYTALSEVSVRGRRAG